MNEQVIRKTAIVAPLVGLLRLMGIHAGFSALGGAIEGATAEGGIKEKMQTGLRSSLQKILNPAEFAKNIIGYQVLPAVGVKALGGVGRSIMSAKPTSSIGRSLYKLDRSGAEALKRTPGTGVEKGFLHNLDTNKAGVDAGKSFFNEYLVGEKAGFLPMLGASLVVEPAFGAVTRDQDAMNQKQNEAFYKNTNKKPIIL